MPTNGIGNQSNRSDALPTLHELVSLALPRLPTPDSRLPTSQV
ncbi:hypothetical protein [Moorena sp. SIOASIH]|nr:hypothetical protein [Moorena sp. SIOASIH]